MIAILHAFQLMCSREKNEKKARIKWKRKLKLKARKRYNRYQRYVLAMLADRLRNSYKINARFRNNFRNNPCIR